MCGVVTERDAHLGAGTDDDVLLLGTIEYQATSPQESHCAQVSSYAFFYILRKKNRHTSIMYALSLGFIIFLGVSSLIQTDIFLYNQQHSSGTFLVVYAAGQNEKTMKQHYIPMATVSAVERAIKTSAFVADHALISSSLSDMLPNPEQKTEETSMKINGG